MVIVRFSRVWRAVLDMAHPLVRWSLQMMGQDGRMTAQLQGDHVGCRGSTTKLGGMCDLLRGVVAYVLGPLSTRRRGGWAGLMGLADLSEAAWRQRLRARNDWRLWLLGERMAVPTASALAVPPPTGRLLVVEARGLGQPGGTGDDG